MGRAPCCDKSNVKRGPWSPEEDTKLKDYIQKHATGGNWIALPQKAGLKRCGKSCRLRWLNYLRPNIKHGPFSLDEDRIICTLFATIGSRWSIMAAQLPGRTDNDIKNYWNTKLKKKMMMNNIISITPNNSQFRKSHHHHLESFISSSNCSSLLQTTSIDNIDALSSSSPLLDPMQNHQLAKDSSTLLTFGGSGSDQASCSSTSDGSCHYEFGVGVYDNYNQGFVGNFEKARGYYGDSSLDSSLEEFKKLISTNIDNNLNLFLDENKEEQKIMYY